MSSWIDVVGSFITGAIIILILANLNIYISSSTANNLYTNVVQQNLITTAEVLQYDFYKIGYHANSNRIIKADSNSIKFYADINNSGKNDIIYYYLGSTAGLSGTKNPNDRVLYKSINNAAGKPEGNVTNFKLTYYDSLGNQLSYSKLQSASIRNNIRTINIYLKVESPDPIDGVYQAAEWERRIFPRNYN